MSAEEYRRRASDFFKDAETATTAGARTWLLELARSWLRLAEQAEKNQASDLVYETPPPAGQRVAQQQQQAQPRREDEKAPRSADTAPAPEIC